MQQSGYALLGELAKAAIVHVKPALGALLPTVLKDMYALPRPARLSLSRCLRALCVARSRSVRASCWVL